MNGSALTSLGRVGETVLEGRGGATLAALVVPLSTYGRQPLAPIPLRRCRPALLTTFVFVGREVVGSGNHAEARTRLVGFRQNASAPLC
jgi:hypothetical protein